MSARVRKKAKNPSSTTWWESLRLRGLLVLVLALYLGLALSGPRSAWWLAMQEGESISLLPAGNPGGPVGAVLSLALCVICGAFWCWFVPTILALEGCALLVARRSLAGPILRRAVPLWLVTAAWLAQPEGMLAPATGAQWGGVIGVWIGRGFHLLFGAPGGRLLLTVLVLLTVGICCRRWLSPLISRLPSLADLGHGAVNLGSWLLTGVRSLGRWSWQLLGVPLRIWQRYRAERARQQDAPPPRRRTEAHAEPAAGRRVSTAATPAGPAHPDEVPTLGLEEPLELTASPQPAAPARAAAASGPRRPSGQIPAEAAELPGLDLLHERPLSGAGHRPVELEDAADLLEKTLRSFGVEGEVKDVRPGPVVTTFEYQPAAGIKVNQITQRSNDLALTMKARTIRMEAPIPGKAAVGIEIPNAESQFVYLKDVLEATADKPSRPLSVVLGKNVVGKPVTIDIGSLPHLLVAGSTGSGKSVCLNCIICNLLLHNTPQRVRLVLIDPKMLEMNVYNGLPHLLLPVLTDPKEALKALKWMVSQMDARYRRLARVGVRNIEAYNQKVARGEVTSRDGEPVTEPMPYYLTIVDELADLMLQLGQDFELPITRLAGKARAVGIHLILATQRPSVDVLTGVIKANIPCRIAFRVIQRNDSRTILDMNGAESLLGSGDMLYLQPGRALPVRVHGAFIDLEECEAIVNHWLQYEDLAEPISLDEGVTEAGIHTGEDELFEEARRIVVIHQSGSTSLLQRRLRIGYTRAGRLIDMLEEAGIVGPFTGSKARDVLIKPEELTELQANEGEA